MGYARNMHLTIKDGKVEDFNKMLTTDVLPVLKKQKGFREYTWMLNKNDFVGISLWEDRPSAETYHSTTYPDLVKKLTPVLHGTPTVNNFDTVNVVRS